MVLVKSVEIDIGVKGDRESKAKLDDINKRAETLKKAFPEYKLKIDSAAASERLKVFRAQLADATKDRTATVKVKVDDSALAKFAKNMQKGGGPSWLGPALALTPAIGTLGGVGAGAAIGLGGAAVAGAGALAAFGAVAKPVLADALKASQAVNTAQNNYTVAIAAGTKQAVAYKAEQIAIGKAYAELSPAQIALSKQIGAMADAWDNVKAAQTPVVAGALQPWLKSVTDLTGKLAPIIAQVSPVIKEIGTQFNTLVNSSAFTTFVKFIAGTGSQAVGAAGNLLTGFLDAAITLLPKFNPLIQAANRWVSGLGDSLARWANSQKTADQITAFMKWFSTNGPVVGGLLKNIGLALKALTPGLTTGGMMELQVMSQFFAFVAKLPPGLARPLAEVAGALLILNKLGVVSVGVKLLGMDAAKAAAAGGTAGLWGKLLPGVRLAGGALIAVVAVDMILKNTSSGPGGKNWLDNPFGADPKSKDTAKQGLSTWAGLGNQIVQIWDKTWANTITRTAKGFHDIAGWFNKGRHDTAAIAGQTGRDVVNWWNITWNNTITRTAKGFHDLAGWFDTGRHWISARWDQVRRDAAAAWDTIWANTVSRVSRGIGDVVRWFAGLPGKVVSATARLGADMITLGKTAIGDVVSGMGSAITGVLKSVGNFFVSIYHAALTALHMSPPHPGSMFYDLGANMMHHMTAGFTSNAGKWKKLVENTAQFSAASLAGSVGGSGVQRWRGTVQQALGLAGANVAQLTDPVLYQMQTESGGNPTIVNRTDSNWLAGHPSVGLMQVIAGTFDAYAGRFRNTGPFEYGVSVNPLANIYAAVKYAQHTYGPGLRNAYGGIGTGTGYDQGGWLMPGLTLAYNATGKPERVIPPGGAGGNTYHITVNVPPNANMADVGRVTVTAIKAFEKNSGKGWRK